MGRFSKDSVTITPEVISAYYRDPIRASPLDGPRDKAPKVDVPVRPKWNNKAEFLLSCISLSVGLGNVWRFPYLAYANGGGAFLIPYICVLFLIGKPMYFMEIAFGQYHAQGAVKVWKRAVPLARGVGVGQVVVCYLVSTFYVVIMAWTMFYFWATLIAACRGEDVPWQNFCDNEWAHKETCSTIVPVAEEIHSNLSETVPVVQFDDNMVSDAQMHSAAQQYFDRAVTLQYKKGTMEKFDLTNMGGVNLYMLAALAGSWFTVFLSLIKGVKSSGKVVYLTSTMPFIVLFILLGRGASLDNAVEGIKYFVTPKFDKLLTIGTWRAAAEQMFFSLSVAFGSLTMLGSYNDFHNNCYRDGMIVSILDSVTSIISGLAMFSVLGYLAGRLDVGIENVVSSGPGLAFVTFPEAVTQMPVPHLWAILFFIMLFTLGLGSELGLLENVLTFICDRFPKLREKRPHVAAVCVSISFLIGLPFTTQGGLDLFVIFDSYAGGMSVLCIAAFEVTALMWIYGLKRFVNNLREMLGDKGNLGYYFRTAWIILSPGTLVFILLVSIITYEPLSNKENGLPAWADAIGWGLTGAAVIQIPIWAIYSIYQAPGADLKQKFIQSLWPDSIMMPLSSDLNVIATSAQTGSTFSSQPRPNYVNAGYQSSFE